jgi:hypothetical protein
MIKYVYVTGAERLRRLRAKYKAMVAALMEDIGQLEVERDAATKSLIESEAACDLAIAERDEARRDVVAAAGELRVDIAEAAYGSTVARLLAANAMMRRERDEARAVARQATDEIGLHAELIQANDEIASLIKRLHRAEDNLSAAAYPRLKELEAEIHSLRSELKFEYDSGTRMREELRRQKMIVSTLADGGHYCKKHDSAWLRLKVPNPTPNECPRCREEGKDTDTEHADKVTRERDEARKLYQETLAELVEEKDMCARLRGEIDNERSSHARTKATMERAFDDGQASAQMVDALKAAASKAQFASWNEVKPTEAEQAECEKRRAEHDDPRRK